MRKILQLFATMMAINLQLFAEAGSVVNTTGGHVNAYNGDATTTNSMDPQMKAFYDTSLLENARVDMVYAQFAKRQNLPAGNGKTVEWRKWNTFDRAEKLQEGVIPTGQTFGSTLKTASVDQYGTFTSVSDVLELQAYDDVIMGATEEMGASAAETQETLIRDALLVNTNVYYCPNVEVDTGKVSGAQPTSCEQLMATADTLSKLTPDDVAKIVTIMKKNKAKPINGLFVAVIHPSAAYDLRRSEEWVDAHKYAKPEEIFNGEIGKLHGCRFIENVYAPVLGDGYRNAGGTVTYATYFFGKDAFGIIDPEGGALQMIVKSKEEVGGPLEQFSTIGYKFMTNGATVLYPERVLRCMSCSSFSGVDEPN